MASQPTSLGKYQLLRKLATSALAEIWVGKSTTAIAGVEQIVALKRVLPQHTRHVEFVRAFVEEARMAAILHHPNIVQVFDVQTEGGELYLVMEYLQGENVSTLMSGLRERKMGLPLEQALSIVIGAAAGLHHAHDKKGTDGKPLNIVHGDVTPENVFITYDGGVKVMDFGIARSGKRLAEVSEAGFKAKAPYLSPEQCKSDPVDRRSDVFALGIILYELTTGYRLFKGLTAVEIMQKIVEKPVELPGNRRPGYPKELERIVMKALQRDRDKRQPTAQALQAEIEEFGRENQLAVSTITLTTFMQRVFGSDAKKDPAKPAGNGAAKPGESKLDASMLPKPRATPLSVPIVAAAPPTSKPTLPPPKRSFKSAPPAIPKTEAAPGLAAIEAPATSPSQSAPIPPAPDDSSLEIDTDDMNGASAKEILAQAQAELAQNAAASADASDSLLLTTPEDEKRKKKLILIGGGIGAAALLLVTCAVVASGGGDKKGAAPQESGAAAPKEAAKSPEPALAPAAPEASPAPSPAAEAAAPSPSPEAAAPTPGFLRVTTTPRAAYVIVDGVEWREKTPTVIDGLSPGEHHIGVTLDGRVPHEETVAIAAGKTTKVSYTLAKEVAEEPPPPAAPPKEHAEKVTRSKPAATHKEEPVEKTVEKTASTSSHLSSSTPTPSPAPPPPRVEKTQTAQPAGSRDKFDAAAWRRRMWEQNKK